MFVTRESYEYICDACCKTITSFKEKPVHYIKEGQNFCGECSVRIVNRQLAGETFENAIKQVIDEGQYKKSLNDRNIMLC